jgi:hypothetical protein
VTTKGWRRLLLALTMIVLAPAVHARERLELRARPVFAFAPSDVQLEFWITPDPENRGLLVSVESDDFYRSSLVELEGVRARKVLWVRYPSLPAGDYNLRGALIDAEGHERASAEKQITVMSTGGEH